MGDVNLNLVLVVSNREGPAQAVIVKQALNYLRVTGESWPLTRERMRFESQAMRLYNELCPGLVPRIYDYDEQMSLMVMEFLGAHEIMRKALKDLKGRIGTAGNRSERLWDEIFPPLVRRTEVPEAVTFRSEPIVWFSAPPTPPSAPSVASTRG